MSSSGSRKIPYYEAGRFFSSIVPSSLVCNSHRQQSHLVECHAKHSQVFYTSREYVSPYHSTESMLYQWTLRPGGRRFGKSFAFTITWWCTTAWTIGRTLNLVYLAHLVSDFPPLASFGFDFPFSKLFAHHWFHYEILLAILETMLAIPPWRTMGVLFFGFALIMAQMLTGDAMLPQMPSMI